MENGEVGCLSLLLQRQSQEGYELSGVCSGGSGSRRMGRWS